MPVLIGARVCSVDNNNASRQDKQQTTGSATSNAVTANKNVLWTLEPRTPDEEEEFYDDGENPNQKQRHQIDLQ
jgi:hypothetical protein